MIDFLYANGCSWTGGNGIENDSSLAHLPEGERWDSFNNLSWPAVVAEKLGVDYKNEGLGAASNKRMVRMTCDFLQNYPKEKYSSLVVMLGWTTVDRNEVYLRENDAHGWCMFNASQPFSSHGRSFIPDFSKEFVKKIDSWQKDYLTDVYSSYANYVYFFQEMYLMSNLLENLGIKYLFFSSIPWKNYWIPGEYVFDIENTFKAQINSLLKPAILNTRPCSDSLNVMKEFCIHNNVPMTHNGTHTMIEGHKLWGEHLYREFKNIYG